MIKRFSFTIALFFAFLFGLFAQNATDGIPDNYKPDFRIDNMGYWRKMAEMGLVDVQKNITPPLSTFKGSLIEATTVVTDDSPDVPVTEENSTQSENSVFVNPTNPDNVFNSNNSTQNPVGILYGANAFYSYDAGLSWDGQLTGTGSNNSGDPAAVIGLDGTYFNGFINSSSGQSVARSDDGGNTWTAYTVAPKPPGFMSLLDKNHLWIDNCPDSPYQGYLYNAWTNFGGSNNNEIEICRSIDGAQTWSTPVNISQAVNAGSHCQGVNINTGPNGEVYAVFTIYDSSGDEDAIGMAISTNGGASFAPATRIIDNIRGIRGTETSKNMRVNSFPVVAVDISDGPYQGHIYVVWSNIGTPGINSGNDIDVYMIKSTNGGSSWSNPLKINQDPSGQGKEHYFPWITCDPETGTLSVIFYDDRNVSSSQCEVWVANSMDGGQNWEDFKVSDVAFTPQPIPGTATGYFGDYLGISARGGMVYPCWTDNRTGTAMTWVSPFETPTAPRPATNPQPENASQGNLPFASLHWKDYNNRANSFKIFLGTDNPPTNIANGTTLSDTFFIPENDFQYNTQYFWQIMSVNNFDSATSEIWSFTTEAAVDEDFESGDLSANEWFLDGDANWSVDNSQQRNGIYAAHSGAIADNQSSSLLIELDILPSPFAVTISFWKKTSCQAGGDKLQFLIDGELKEEWSGETEWSLENFPLMISGIHTFEWKYSKDAGTASGDDAAWIDYISFPPLNVLSANAGPDATICEGSVYQANGNATNYTSLLWETSGDGIFDDPEILSPIYTPGNNDISTGSLTLTLNAFNGAESISDDLALNISAAPEINMPQDEFVCAGNDLPLANVNVQNYSSMLWTTTGDGIFDDPATANPIYTPGLTDIANGGTDLILSLNALLPCNNISDTLQLTIGSAPADATVINGPEEVCQAETSSIYQTNSIEGAEAYDWQLIPETAASIQNNDTSININWEASYHGTASLMVSGTNICGSGTPSDVLNITIKPLPEKATTPQGLEIVCTETQPFIEYTSEGAEYADSYSWELSPADAGTIYGNTNTASLQWNAWEGTAYLKVKGINSCGEGVFSESLQIEAYICEGVNNPKDPYAFEIFPNPASGEFSIYAETQQDKQVELQIINTQNKLAYKATIDLNSQQSRKTINPGNLAEGVYYVILSDGRNQSIRKLMINKH